MRLSYYYIKVIVVLVLAKDEWLWFLRVSLISIQWFRKYFVNRQTKMKPTENANVFILCDVSDYVLLMRRYYCLTTWTAV